jgi:hypothetical protein
VITFDWAKGQTPLSKTPLGKVFKKIATLFGGAAVFPDESCGLNLSHPKPYIYNEKAAALIVLPEFGGPCSIANI